MHNLSDEELDRLGKEAADRYSAPPVQSTWEKLSRRLDDEMPQDKKDRKIIFWLSLLLLLIGGGALYYFTQGNGAANNQQATAIVSSTTEAKEKKIAAVDDAANKATSKSTDVAVEKNSEKNSESVPATTRASGNVADNEPVPKQVRQGETRSSNKIELTVVAKNRAKTNGKKQNSNVLADKEPTPSDVAGSESADESNAGDKKVKSSATDLTTAAPTAADKKDNNGTPAIAKEENTKAKETEKAKKQGYVTPVRKWEFGAVYGPDFSNVKFTDKDDVGLNIGVTIGYNFNRRLSVNTGFLYTKKNYTTSGENYKFPPGYWAGGPNVKMHSVEATCYMFDIPLNLRYNVVAAKKYSIFASAGLSSYLMSKEKFKYYYTYYSAPYNRNWTNNNSDNYFFSIANFSVGYEHQISPSVSLQAEPFFKFSLSEVGFGSVSLNSMGIFASVKYKPAFGSKKATRNK